MAQPSYNYLPSTLRPALEVKIELNAADLRLAEQAHTQALLSKIPGYKGYKLQGSLLIVTVGRDRLKGLSSYKSPRATEIDPIAKDVAKNVRGALLQARHAS